MTNFFENTPIGAMLKRAKTISAETLFVEVFTRKDVQKFVVKQNTDQMRWEYINSDGVLLSSIGGPYAPSTVKNGGKAGPFKIDLYDTGEFHESFKVENVSAKGFKYKIKSKQR